MVPLQQASGDSVNLHTLSSMITNETSYDYLMHAHMLDVLVYALLVGELPVVLFTVLDLLRLDSLRAYRISYDAPRPYPTLRALSRAAWHYVRITFGVLTPLTVVGVQLMKCVHWAPFQLGGTLSV